MTARYGKYLIGLILLLAVSFGCEKSESHPEGWDRGIFKLTEHPEAISCTLALFNEMRSQLTLNDDTRQGFDLRPGGRLPFDVYIPANAELRFAVGSEERISKILIKVEGENETVNSSESYQPDPGKWEDYRISLANKKTVKARVEFYVPDDADGNIFVAHPYITSRKRTEPTRIIWISIDTLRADHLGCYGYERNTSPNIDAIAAEGTLFERCISVSPWTFPSYSSMFTGRYPSITGATTDVWQLPESEITLAEIISSDDFLTFCVSNIIWVNEGTALNQGFDSLKWYVHDYADKSFDLAREWLDEHPNDDCFMLIQLVDPHVPYKPKEEFNDTFDPGYEGRFKHDFPNFVPFWNGEDQFTDEEKYHLEALYDECILGCDADLGEFVGYLKEKGIYDESLLIVNSDHGEEFWEHGGFEHGHQLYDEVIHVPLIIKGSGIEEGKRIDQMCATIDIFPTILEWLGKDVPNEINGMSLFNLENGEIEPETRMLLSEQLYHGNEQKGVSTDRYRYILHTIDQAEELYDIDEDPAMLADVASDRRSTSRNFRYFAKEYMLNEDAGWHVRFFRHPTDPHGAFYAGTIKAESGFASVNDTRLGKDDDLTVGDKEISFGIQVENWDNKAFDFRTNDEDDIVSFEIRVDDRIDADGYLFVGSDKLPYESSFEISIMDPVFGLGQPLFGPIGLDVQSGVFIWGLSETLRETSSPEIDERTKEELKSLGYLQ